MRLSGTAGVCVRARVASGEWRSDLPKEASGNLQRKRVLKADIGHRTALHLITATRAGDAAHNGRAYPPLAVIPVLAAALVLHASRRHDALQSPPLPGEDIADAAAAAAAEIVAARRKQHSSSSPEQQNGSSGSWVPLIEFDTPPPTGLFQCIYACLPKIEEARIANNEGAASTRESPAAGRRPGDPLLTEEDHRLARCILGR